MNGWERLIKVTYSRSQSIVAMIIKHPTAKLLCMLPFTRPACLDYCNSKRLMLSRIFVAIDPMENNFLFFSPFFSFLQEWRYCVRKCIQKTVIGLITEPQTYHRNMMWVGRKLLLKGTGFYIDGQLQLFCSFGIRNHLCEMDSLNSYCPL